MRSALGDKEYSTLKPPLPFIWVYNLVGNPFKMCSSLFNKANKPFGNGVESANTVGVSEHNFVFILCCCDSLPINNI